MDIDKGKPISADVRRLRLPDFKTVSIWRLLDCQLYTAATFTSQEIIPILISVSDWVDPKAILRGRKIMSMINPNYTIGNPTLVLLAVAQYLRLLTAPPRAPPCKYLFYHTATVPSEPRSLPYPGFTITLRHTTLDRTSLDEWSARRRDLYLTTHNNHNRQTFITRWDSYPQSQKASGRRPTP
jgi:hypothetical protein